MNANKPSRAARFGQRISLLAAILIVTVLVGSLILVLNNIRHPGTNTASGPQPTSIVTPSPTPTPSPISTGTPSAANAGHVVYTSSVSFDDFYAFAWSPDSKRIASSTNSQVTIWDATTGKHSRTFTPSGNGASVLTLAWSPNGKYLAVGSGQLQIIDSTTGNVIRTFPASVALGGNGSGSPLSAHLPLSGGNMIYSAAWSPDGNLIAASLNGNAYGNSIVVWNVSNGQIIYTFRGQTSESGPGSVSWSPDGKYIVSGSYAGNVQVWNAHTGQVIFNHQNCGPDAAWSPIGMEVAFHCANNTMQVWDVTTNTMVSSRKDSTNSGGTVIWSPDGQKLANTSDTKIVIWSAVSGKTIYTFAQPGGSYARSLAWSPDGKYIVSGSGGETGNNFAVVWTAR